MENPLSNLYHYFINYKAAQVRGNKEAAEDRLRHMAGYMRTHNLNMGDLEEEVARRAQQED